MIAGCRARIVNNIRRFDLVTLVCFFRVLRRFFAIGERSERLSIGIDIPGRLRNGGRSESSDEGHAF